MKVIVCGSREWTDRQAILDSFNDLLRLQYTKQFWATSAVTAEEHYKQVIKGITIIEGDARGADRLAGEVASKIGFAVVTVLAEWDRYGNRAGPIRNQKMLKMLLEDDDERLVIAFHEDLPNSKGTKDMIQRAVAAGVKVIIVSKPKRPGYGARQARTLQP